MNSLFKILLTSQLIVILSFVLFNSNPRDVEIVTFEDSKKYLKENPKHLDRLESINKLGAWGSVPFEYNDKIYCIIFEEDRYDRFKYNHEKAHCEMSEYNLKNETPFKYYPSELPNQKSKDAFYVHGFEIYSDLRAIQQESKEGIFNHQEISNKRKNDLCVDSEFSHWTSFYIDNFVTIDGYENKNKKELIEFINDSIDNKDLINIYNLVESNKISNSSYCKE